MPQSWLMAEILLEPQDARLQRLWFLCHLLYLPRHNFYIFWAEKQINHDPFQPGEIQPGGTKANLKKMHPTPPAADLPFNVVLTALQLCEMQPVRDLAASVGSGLSCKMPDVKLRLGLCPTGVCVRTWAPESDSGGWTGCFPRTRSHGTTDLTQPNLTWFGIKMLLVFTECAQLYAGEPEPVQLHIADVPFMWN